MFNNVKLGIAPIGWTNDDMPQLGGELTFEQMISEAALAGFQGTEVGGKFPTNPTALNRALDLRGIKIASQWFSSFLCSTPYEENEKAFLEQLDFLEAVGAKRINVCELTRNLFAEECSMFGDNKPVASDEEWDRLCDGLNRLGKIAADRGFKYKTLAYTLSGLCAAIASVILVSKLNSAQSTAGLDYEMDAIASCVIGGTSLLGGFGSVWGTFVGAIIMIVIRNGLNLLNVSSNLQKLVIGILLAVLADAIRHKAASGKK